MNSETGINPPSTQRSSSVVWLLLAAICGMLFIYLYFGGRTGGGEHAAVGKPVQHLSLTPLTGDPPPIDLANLQGKVTLMNFWGPWCYYCLKELPHLVELRDRLKSEPDFQLLSISCSSDWSPQIPPGMQWQEDATLLAAQTEQYLQKANLNLPTYVDASGSTRASLGHLLGGWQGYPTTVLLDRKGVIRGVWIGYAPGMEAQMQSRARELLAESK